jgi:hypothetical protein
MAFNVSPSVNVREVDLTTGVPQLSTTIGAAAGVMRWGPLSLRVLVDSEQMLAARFGKPTNLNAETWFNAASFLAYGNQLYVSRAANTAGISPIVTVVSVAGNATLTGTDTTNLVVGMILVASNSSALSLGTTIASIVNTTAVTIASGSHALANATSSVQFVSNNAAFTSMANTGQVSNFAGQIVKNDDDFTTKDGTFDADVAFIARYPGLIGDSLRISVVDSAQSFMSTMNLVAVGNGGATVSINVGSNAANVTIIYGHDGTSQNNARLAVNTAATNFAANLQVTDLLEFGNSSVGTQSLKISAIDVYSSNVNATIAAATFNIQFEDELRIISNVVMANTLTRFWEWFDLMDVAPGQSDWMTSYGNTSANDELHAVVVDHDGLFSGVAGTVLESYKGLSRATDSKNLDGGSNYYKTVINQNSQYVWVTNDRTAGYSNTGLNLASTSNASVQNLHFYYGQDGSDETNVALGVLSNAWDFFQAVEEVDVSLILAGKARGGTAGGQMANYLIDNLAELRKDCVVFVSPEKADVVNTIGNEVDNVVEFRNTLRSTSYGFLDSGYKYMYDRYNDIYRWIPLNGDMAGLAVRTDTTNDPWWSFAGYNRGGIKNVVRLAWNPKKSYRDELYKRSINPVITEPGQGTLLLGDKTLLSKESAFSRIGVRRLFITIEKAIATTAKYFLFEFNDEFTRAMFRNTITPYLRDIQGRRGIYDFQVVCDATNNDADTIDSWTMNGDIYIKPARSINYINLTFVAVRTGVAFQEIIGKAF